MSRKNTAVSPSADSGGGRSARALGSNPNPLLAYGSLPRFDAAKPEHVRPAVDEILEQAEADLEALEASAEPSWDGVIVPLARIGERLGFAWSIVQHLMGVQNSDELREAHERRPG